MGYSPRGPKSRARLSDLTFTFTFRGQPAGNWRLPSTSPKVKSWSLQLLTFNIHTLKGVQGGDRNEELCALEKTGRTGL